MTNELKKQVNDVAMTRAMIDIPTSLLLNIKANLKKLLTEELEGTGEVQKQMFHNLWKAEIEGIELEIIKRN